MGLLSRVGFRLGGGFFSGGFSGFLPYFFLELAHKIFTFFNFFLEVGFGFFGVKINQVAALSEVAVKTQPRA